MTSSPLLIPYIAKEGHYTEIILTPSARSAYFTNIIMLKNWPFWGHIGRWGLQTHTQTSETSTQNLRK